MTQARPDTAPAASGWPAPPPPRLRALGAGVRAGVALHAAAAAAGVAAGALEQLAPARLGVGVAWAATLLVAGVLWAVWQHRAARPFPPGTIRRSPAWHAWSWVVPGVALWYPYQNVADLFSAAVGRRPWWLPVWWAAWVPGVLAGGAAAALALAGDAAAQAWTPPLFVAGGALTLVAAPFAWPVVARLTAAVGRGA